MCVPYGLITYLFLCYYHSAQKDASESGSESDSSQSGSDSENESSEDAQEQRQQQPMLGQQIAPDERAIQASNKGQQQQQRVTH